MLKRTLNSFIEGLNKDLDKSILSNKAYISSKNMRLVTEKGQTGGAKENMLGNTYIGSTVANDLYIVGYTWIRDTLILFATSNDTLTPTTGDSRIYSVTFSHKVVDTITQLYADGDGKGYLKFSRRYLIEAVGRYESAEVQKVYWVDEYNNARYCNIEDGGLATQNTDLFEMVPNFSMTRPYFVDIITGNIPVGKVQYAYQLYKHNGSETLFSPASDLISLTSSSYSFATSNLHKGGQKEEDSGKGVKGSITLNTTGFNRVRIIGIHYDTLGGIPTIRLVTEKQINEDDTYITFIDNGENLGEYTLEEFSIVSRIVFSGRDIENKGDNLFVGNITEKYFDVDYDARAYRYNSSDVARVYDDNDYYYDISDVGAWTYYDDGGNTTGTTGTNFSLPESADCINKFNDLDNDGDSNFEYKYKANGTTIGAEGRYTAINVGVSGFQLDQRLTLNETYSAVNLVPTYFRYPNYSGPVYTYNRISYQRDETYRFGIIFFDEKGRESFVKWICDFRFPTNVDNTDYELTSKSANILSAVRLYTTITVNTSGTDAEDYNWQVVRVARSTGDKSVVAQGLLSHTLTFTGATPDEYRNPILPSWTQPASGPQYTRNRNTAILISPEVNINKDLSVAGTGDFIHVKGKYGAKNYSNINSSGATSVGTGESIYSFLFNSSSSVRNFAKYADVTEYDGALLNIDITDGKIIESSHTKENSFDLGDTYNYVNWSNKNENDNGHNGPSSTKLAIKLDSEISDTFMALSDYEPLFVNYKRNVFSTQYGGNTYEDRLNNEYFPCSDVKEAGGTSITSQVGDTFINMYEYTHSMWNEKVDGDDSLESGAGQKAFFNFYFPVETSINTNFRYEDSWSRTPSNLSAVLMREIPGIYEGDDSKYFEQDFYLYSYNSVYSQENTTKKYFPQQLDFESITEFDTRVLASDRKFNNEPSDSWTIFRANNFLDVDPKFGVLSNLEEYRDKLYFWQPDRAFGELSVNKRSLIQDNNTSSLVLGTGGILDRYDYISTEAGNSNLRGIIKSNSGMYWVDNLTKEVYFFNGVEQKLSKVKGIQSDFNNYDGIYDVVGAYDKQYNEIMTTVYPFINATLVNEGGMGGVEYDLTVPDTSEMTAGDEVVIDGYRFTIDSVDDATSITVTVNSTIVNNYANGDTVSISVATIKDTYLFSDMSQNYIDNPSIKPSMYIDAGEFFMSSLDDRLLYTHNLGDYGVYYGGSVVDAELSFIVNENYYNTKVWSSLMFDSRTVNSSDVNQYEITFSEIRCSTEYMSTGWVEVDTERYSDDRNAVKHEGHWVYNVPRNAVNASREDNVDIFDTDNLDYDAREFKERLRDNYMRVDLKFDNADNYKFSVPYIITNYQESVR